MLFLSDKNGEWCTSFVIDRRKTDDVFFLYSQTSMIHASSSLFPCHSPMSRSMPSDFFLRVTRACHHFRGRAEEVILNEERTTEEEKQHILEGESCLRVSV